MAFVDNFISFFCLCHSLRVYVLVTSRYVLVVSTYFNFFGHILKTSKTLFMWSPCSILKFSLWIWIKANTLWPVLMNKRIERFLLFLFYFLNCCKNCYRPATSSSRFGLEFESCDILFFKIHDHLEWYFVYIYFVKFWFSKSFEIAAVLNYNNFIFVLHRNYVFCGIHWFSFTVCKFNVLGPNLPVIKATSRRKKTTVFCPLK